MRTNVGERLALAVMTCLLATLVSPQCDASDAGNVVTFTIEQVEVPRRQAVTDALSSLVQATESMRDTPSPERIAIAQSAWRTAKVAWEAYEPVLVGPGYRKRFRVDFWPTRPRTLRRALASEDPVTPRPLTSMAQPQKVYLPLDGCLQIKTPSAQMSAVGIWQLQ